MGIKLATGIANEIGRVKELQGAEIGAKPERIC
jgi:hypothetical protein